MFTPKYPRLDVAPNPTTMPPAAAPVLASSDAHTPACSCGHGPTPAPVPTRPTVQLTPGALITLAVGGTAAVLVIGTVLVSMLLAVAVTGASVAVCAVVVRSLLKDTRNHR